MGIKPIQTFIHFVLSPDEENNKWSLSFASDNVDTIQVGLHWDEKPHPTHVFQCTKDEFRKMSKTLLGEP